VLAARVIECVAGCAAGGQLGKLLDDVAAGIGDESRVERRTVGSAPA
jgi:hypothetical protein